MQDLDRKLYQDTIDHCLTDDNKIGREFIDEILLGIFQEDIVSADFAEYPKEAKKARKTNICNDTSFILTALTFALRLTF